MHILVTGAAGFVGSHVARRFLQRGDRVTGLDNFNDYHDPAQKYSNATGLGQFESFRLLALDIRDNAALVNLFGTDKFDAIVHLAGYAGVRNSVLNPQLYFDVNLNASIQLLELARNHDVGNFVFASTSSVYGQTKSIPFVETDPCTNPPQPYAASPKPCHDSSTSWRQQQEGAPIWFFPSHRQQK